MKKLILFIFIIFSCDMVNYNIWNIPEIDIEIQRYNEVFTGKVYDIEICNLWIFRNIEYKDEGIKDYWQTPIETYNKKSGDCEDMSILLIALIMKYFPEKNPEMVSVYTGLNYHAVVLCDGRIYDPTNCEDWKLKNYKYGIIWKYSFDYIQKNISYNRPVK